MGRHSRPRGAAGTPDATRAADATGPLPAAEGTQPAGRRRRTEDPQAGRLPGSRPVPGTSAPHQGGTTPAHGVPVRGGHPEHHESGGGWNEPSAPRPAAPAHPGPGVRIPGPRREYVDAFDGADWTNTGTHRVPNPSSDTGSHRVADWTNTGTHRVPNPSSDTGSHRVADWTDTGTHRVANPSDTGTQNRTAAPTDTGAYRRVGPADPGARRGPDPMGTGSHRRMVVADTGEQRRIVPAPTAARPAPAPAPAPAPERAEPEEEQGTVRKGRSVKGRTLTGIAAAAVTTVLAVVVAGQVTSDDGHRAGAQAADGSGRGGEGPASRSKDRSTPQQAAPAKPATYEQKMALQYPIDPKLKGSGEFETVPGSAAAPGKGRKYRYRVDIEKGLELDGALFAEAVQKTLNDDRSWAHDGAKTFERVSSGKPDFVVTLASPGTTGTWCAKSELDVTEENVSCDSAATERVMINAFRWAQGSETFGAQAMFAYRQMLINHEVGHRLGHGHVSCRTPGALAPVMQQQTKSLDIDGIKCRPNPWVYPTG
ncbi:DUF3152 domain-containing protein [Streptomyces sp. NPDC051597]|uniref:DUF3152 domain-containing protein n=1 Tax=Streptomyces sp. NPDC051597 TaxID=3155049 RepID=UPI00341F86A4